MNLISTLIIAKPQHHKLDYIQIPNSYEATQLLFQILEDETSTLREIYCNFQILIQGLEKEKGPKRFTNILNSIFLFIQEYSYDRLMAYQEDLVVLNLTYYEIVFNQYLDPIKKLEIIIIFITANIHTFLRTGEVKKLSSAEDKLLEISQYNPQGYLDNIIKLQASILAHLRQNHKMARTLLSNLLSKLITENKDIMNKPECLEIMAIISYYSYLNMIELGEQELSYYYLTKAFEIGKKLGNESNNFMNKIKEHTEHKSFRVVKLTRIENKLEVLNRKTKHSWHSKSLKSKIYTQKTPTQNPFESEELKNILTIKDTKATMYKFKKDNMRYLTKEQNKLTLDIQNKENELAEINEMKKKLDSKREILEIHDNIEILNEQKRMMIEEYLQLKTKYLDHVKPIKTISKCIKGFLTLNKYPKQLSIYNFLYGELLSRSKILILSFCLRKRMQKVKKYIKYYKIMYEGLLHFVEIYEILQHKPSSKINLKFDVPGFYIKIFPIEKKNGNKGIDDEKEIDENLKNRLISVPFYYEFDTENGKMINWDQCLTNKKIITVYYVKKFMQIMSKRILLKDCLFQKIHVCLMFGDWPCIEMTLFCSINENASADFLQESGKIKHEARVYKISGEKYKSKLYNFSFDRKVYIESKTLSQEAATELVREEFHKSCQKYLKSILKLQRFIRQTISKKKLENLRCNNKISVLVSGKDIVSFCKYSTGKSYIIVENMGTRDREIVETVLSFMSLKEIECIREKLVKEKSCKDKLRLTCKYIWTKFFMSKLKNHFKGPRMTEFQMGFKNRIIFSKKFNNFMYKRKMHSGTVIFTLSVENLFSFPRPYTLRIFTISKESILIDVKQKIFNKEKLFYEKNQENLNRIVNIQSKSSIESITEQEENETKIRTSSRYSRSSMIRSISNAASENESFNNSNDLDLVPKYKSKKSSMLVRFKNRKSNELGTLKFGKRFSNQIFQECISSKSELE